MVLSLFSFNAFSEDKKWPPNDEMCLPELKSPQGRLLLGEKVSRDVIGRESGRREEAKGKCDFLKFNQERKY